MIAAEENVLPVVDELAGFPIGERRGPSAQPGPRVKEQYADVSSGQRGRGTEPRKAAADHDNRACSGGGV